MTLEEQIKNEIQAVRNNQKTEYANWQAKNGEYSGQVTGLQKALDLIEKAKKGTQQ